MNHRLSVLVKEWRLQEVKQWRPQGTLIGTGVRLILMCL